MSEGPDETLHATDTSTSDATEVDQDSEPASVPSGAAAEDDPDADQDAGAASEPAGAADEDAGDGAASNPS